jgi:hypothetical protein
METIAQVLNKNFDLHKDPIREEVSERILSEINCLKQKIVKLDCPQFYELIGLALAWQSLDRELRALEDTIQKYSAKKPINPVDDLLKKLRKKS